VEEIDIGGGIVEARFVSVTGYLHPPAGIETQPHVWRLEVGFIDRWRALYPCILGNVGFLDQFTVTISRPPKPPPSNRQLRSTNGSTHRRPLT
jgi:hypothetical protein